MLIQDKIDIPNTAKQDFFNNYNKNGIDSACIQEFQKIMWEHYKQVGRKFAWRENITPYKVVVSEIMLQQTQTNRVIEKFDWFIKEFPDFKTLAQAPFDQVLKVWKGLGYNRRAMNLQKIAHIVVTDYKGQLPKSVEALEKFPGIGKATARSICAFAFDQPTEFIETNIRTVYIYFFLQGRTTIHDNDIMPFISATVDQNNPREWYYALMDYGVMLKKTVGNLCKQSKHYTKQSKFEGSDRQIRGMILQALLDNKKLSPDELFNKIDRENTRIEKMLQQLIDEGFVIQKKQMLELYTR